MAFQLRDYQKDALNSCFDYLRNKDGNPVLVLPTGAGKSVIVSEIMQEVLKYDGHRALCLTHVSELIVQNHSKMPPAMNAGIYSAGVGKRDIYNRILFCGIQSVYKKANLFSPVNLIVIDECFSGDTEILTENGYIRFDRLKDDTKVAQFNQIDQSITFVKPERIIKKKPDSKMIKMSSKKYGEFLITENHDMLIERDISSSKVLKTKLKDCKFNGYTKFFTSGKASGEDHNLTNIEKFLIMTQADGNIHRRNKDGSTLVYFTFSKDRKIYEFNKLMDSLPWGVNEISGGSGSSNSKLPRRRFSVKVPFFVDKDITKIFNISELSLLKAQNIIEYMNKWDGHVASKNIWLLTTTDKKIADFYQAVCQLSGYHSKMSHIVDKRSDKYNDTYRLFININSNKIGTQGFSKEEVDYNDYVYCVSVPEGNIAIRRNGNVLITGNCHLLSPNQETMYGQFIGDLKKLNPKIRVIGLTATPYRTGDGVLTDCTLFDDIAYNLPMEHLIDQGYLSPLKGKRGAIQADMSNVKTTAGEFNLKEMAAAYDQNHITAAAVSEILEYGKSRKKALIFCSSVQHCYHVAEFIRNAGERCEVITGETKDRDLILAQHRHGVFKYLLNFGVLTTGYDDPEIDLIGLLRGTQSTSLYVQMLGRGMRPVYADGHDLSTQEGRLAAMASGGKPNGCLVLDYGQNVETHGPVDKIVIEKKYNLKKDSVEDAIVVQPTKMCPACGLDNHLQARICPECGHEYDVKPKHAKEASNAAILSADIEPEWFWVEDMVLSRHQKKGAPDSLKIVYLTGLGVKTEWVALENPRAARFAKQWWRKRGSGEIPRTVTEALERQNDIKQPERIAVKPEGKYERIVNYEDDLGIEDLNRINREEYEKMKEQELDELNESHEEVVF